MKKTLVAAVALAASFVCPAEDAGSDSLKVLMIGNSFSICNLWQMPQIAKSMGKKLDLASLCIGGCSLERHWNNVEICATNAAFKPYGYDRVTDGKRIDGTMANVPDVLAHEKWDVITVQQASHYSWDPKTYDPFGDKFVAFLRERAPQAKIVVQETWSYPPWDKRLKDFGFDQVDMYARLHGAYAAFAGRHGFDVIPTGTAAEFAPDRNTLFTKPDFHFNKTGEYLQGLVWTAKLFGADVTTCAYRPAWLDAARADELKRAAMAAVRGAKGVARRAFRDARLTRGNTNVMKLQPIDDASWLWVASDAAPAAAPEGITHDARTDRETSSVCIFRKKFEVKPGDGALVFDVSADERFYLTLDGQFVARGPNRAEVENWQYNTYVADLPPGEHEMRAVVTRVGEHAPLAQLSWRGGFVFKANGVYDARLTTGKAAWEVGRFPGMSPNGSDNGVWGTGSQFVIEGAGPYAVEPAAWEKPVVVRGPASCREGTAGCGGRTPGWMLFPSQIPDQTENVVRPGAFRAATHAAGWRSWYTNTEADVKAPEVAAFNDLLAGKVEKVVVPANTKLQMAWHLGRYICAYPQLTVSGGKGARVAWTWTESARDAATRRKGNRGEIVGKYVEGYGDDFLCDGREKAVFSAPWFRCGLWCRIDVETKDAPLEIRDLALIENRYPLEMESAFSSPDDPSLQDVRRICARAMQMCCHEMLFDCPFYEQQMYPGDSRVQMLVLSALSRDDRIIKRAMEIYDVGTRDDGQCPFNWPTRGTQEGFTYTLCYLAMYGDYAMNHADFDWLRARLPGMRKSMSGCELYENDDGLVENTPGWNFMDWTTEWHASSVPNSRAGQDPNSFINLFWLLAMQSAATTERALGNGLQARYWEQKSAKLKRAIVKAFWDAKRGLFADTAEKLTYSEHSQALAILTDCLPKKDLDLCFKHLVEDKDLCRTTVYFNYYLFEAYFKMGRPDLFLKRLDLWRDYVKLGVTTLLECPDTGKNGQIEARSDCHAWGAHPIWFMQTGLAGIKSAAPGFKKVLVAPQPGALKSLAARHPHPQGWIEVDLSFEGGAAKGTVSTPVAGAFKFGGKTVPLKPGVNKLP